MRIDWDVFWLPAVTRLADTTVLTERAFESAVAALVVAVEMSVDCDVFLLDSAVATLVAIDRAMESFELPTAESAAD
jgi:hypothetical protein